MSILCVSECTCMYNFWGFAINNIYFRIFHNLSIRLDISPILQMKKVRLREVKVGNSNVW